MEKAMTDGAVNVNEESVGRRECRIDISSFESFELSLADSSGAETAWKSFIHLQKYSNDKWAVYAWDDVVKNINKEDRKIREQAHEAIIEIVKGPHGEFCSSIKPYRGKLKNHWKYKLRDGFRIVYRIDHNEGKILIRDARPKENIDRFLR